MSFARRAMTLLLLMLLIGPSAMACVVPEAQLTPAEQKCCKMMSHHCGGMAGQSSHSCCKAAVHPDNTFCSAQRITLLPSANLVSGLLPVAATTLLHSASLDELLCAVAHPPPGFLDHTTILRI